MSDIPERTFHNATAAKQPASIHIIKRQEQEYKELIFLVLLLFFSVSDVVTYDNCAEGATSFTQ